MKVPKLLAAVGAFSLSLALTVPASSQQREMRDPAATASRQVEWGASIIPTDRFAVGNSLPGGTDGAAAGAAFTANGVTNYESTCNTCSYNFLFLVFTNKAQTAGITFQVLSPKGTVIFSQTWPSSKLPLGTSWFYTVAKGNFSAAGTYWASVYGDNKGTSSLIGAIPLPFAPAR
jgi:hypothetical protein